LVALVGVQGFQVLAQTVLLLTVVTVVTVAVVAVVVHHQDLLAQVVVAKFDFTIKE
jgi:hypothetical protein